MYTLKKTPSSWKLTLLERYLMNIESSLSESSLNKYRRDLENFLDYLPKRCKIKDVDCEVINAYFKSLRNDGGKDTTIKNRHSILKGFFGWLAGEMYIASNPFVKIKSPRLTRTAPFVPSCEEVSTLLSAVRLKTNTGIRDRAILEILYCTGMRVTEICDLHLSDYKDFKLVIKSSKGNHYRTVPLTNIAKKYLDLYLAEHREETILPNLFVTETGNAMERSLISSMIKSVSKRCDIKGKITPHTLRHACATHLLEHGVDIISIQQLLGHSCIKTTEQYIHLSANRVHSNVLAAHPRGGL